MRICVVGIGNSWASDDGIGPAVVERLRTKYIEDAAASGTTATVIFKTLPHPDLSLLDCLQTCHTLVVVDAVKSGAPPGTVHSHVWYPGLVKSRGVEQVSQHGLGVNDMLQLAAQFNQLPELVILWGIEVACTEPGQAVSAPVAHAFPAVVKGLYTELQRMVRVSIG